MFGILFLSNFIYLWNIDTFYTTNNQVTTTKSQRSPPLTDRVTNRLSFTKITARILTPQRIVPSLHVYTSLLYVIGDFIWRFYLKFLILWYHILFPFFFYPVSNSRYTFYLLHFCVIDHRTLCTMYYRYFTSAPLKPFPFYNSLQYHLTNNHTSGTNTICTTTLKVYNNNLLLTLNLCWVILKHFCLCHTISTILSIPSAYKNKILLLLNHYNKRHRSILATICKHYIWPKLKENTLYKYISILVSVNSLVGWLDEKWVSENVQIKLLENYINCWRIDGYKSLYTFQ